MTDSFSKWANYYQDSIEAGQSQSWPNETMIRLFRGNYIPDLDKNYKGKNVLDIGFGTGANLWFLGTLGLELHGVEVNQEICDIADQYLEKRALKADLKIGTNRSIPYTDDTFDFLTSWNVIHYENNDEDMRSAIAEYRRVLKPGGRFFISTTGPQHMILEDSKTLGGHRYQIGRGDDFRQGQVFFYFDTESYIKYYFSEQFDNVLVGRVHDFLFTAWQDYFVITGVKK